MKLYSRNQYHFHFIKKIGKRKSRPESKTFTMDSNLAQDIYLLLEDQVDKTSKSYQAYYPPESNKDDQTNNTVKSYNTY